MSSKNIAASVSQRLKNRMEETGEPYQYLLSRYGFERLLYRLSVSEYKSNFVLKGALLFYVWNQNLHRPTRDIDFLGFGNSDIDSIREAFQKIVTIEVPDDGVVFDPNAVSVAPIRDEKAYGGLRIKIVGKLGNSRVSVQADVGFGDAITPEADVNIFPTILSDSPKPAIRTYPVYTVVAEKFEAMVMLGDQNSRMKDFFDLHFVFTTEDLDRKTMLKAIKATFSRRGSSIPGDIPRCLTEDFAKSKEIQWKAFLNRNNLDQRMLVDVISIIREHLSFLWT